MPWIIGIDEAGYGPNLGPFVMASVACQVPADHEGIDFWQLLKTVVRRHKEKDDGRLLVEDSKLVYSTTKGLKNLERGVLSILGTSHGIPQNFQLNDFNLSQWLELVSPTASFQLSEECWYCGKTLLPLSADWTALSHASQRFHRTCEQIPLHWVGARCVVVCPSRFNSLLDRWGSKGVVLRVSLAELLFHNVHSGKDGSPLRIFVDKHGGRINYEDVLAQAIPEGRVVPLQESQECSKYQITGLSREIQIQFEPRADAAHFVVALASMLAKYVRELLMVEFNQFWQGHLPELEPTAGYPGDALRFMEAIRPIAQTLGLREEVLWRRK